MGGPAIGPKDLWYTQFSFAIFYHEGLVQFKAYRKSLVKRFPCRSSGLSLDACGIMRRSGMAGNSDGSGRERGYTTKEAIGVGQSAMSAGSTLFVRYIRVVPP